jgi:hypothetical protein
MGVAMNAFQAGYDLLECAEHLLEEAQSDPREYGAEWYLIKLMRIERLLDAFRPGHLDVGDKKFDEYDRREKAVRAGLRQFQDRHDSEVSDFIIKEMVRLDEEEGQILVKLKHQAS